MMGALEFEALWLTLKLASITTLILLVFGAPLSWWLAQSKWRFKFLIESLVALPLVLPPTVLGFYLLVALGTNGFIGTLTNFLGLGSLAFSFYGLIIGSVIYSLPFVVQPLQNAFTLINQQHLESASLLGASPIDRFFSVVVPYSRTGFLTASILGFSHTLGEFGVVLMIGGNIPGETQVVSIALFEHVENLQYAKAHTLALLLLGLSFALLSIVYTANRVWK